MEGALLCVSCDDVAHSGAAQMFQAFSCDDQSTALTRLVTDLSGSVAGRTLLQSLQSTVTSKIRQDFLAVLPEEMAYHILGFLGPKDMLACAGVSRHWRRLAENDRCAQCSPRRRARLMICVIE